MVTRFSQEKLPLASSHAWVTTMASAATPATGWGRTARTAPPAGWRGWPALGPVQRPRQVVEEPAEGARQRLGLVVVVEAGEVTPAAVAAQLDQPGPELDPEQQPAVQPQHQGGRGGPGRAQEHRQEAGFQQQGLPAEAVEGLADVDHRQVQRPQGEPGGGRHPGRPLLGQPEQGGAGQPGPTQATSEGTGPSSGGGNRLGRPEAKDGGQECWRRLEAPPPAAGGTGWP